jgi:MFS family permease
VNRFLSRTVTDKRGCGRAFGFQRALDHTGAMLGPLLAFGLLQWGMTMEHIFIASVIPGAALILLLVLGLKAPADTHAPGHLKIGRYE